MRRKPCFVDKDSYHLKNGRGSTPTKQKEFMEACQDPQWNLDVSTHHRSETNGVAGRAVRTVKIGTPVGLGQSGLPEEWWDCAIGFLVSMHTIRWQGKTAVEKRFLKKLDKQSVISQHWLTTSRTQRKTKVRVTCLKRKSRGRCSGYVLCAGEDGQATYWLRIMDICRDKKLPKFTSKDSNLKKYLCKVHRNFCVHIDILKFPALRRPSSIDCGRQFSA